MLFVYIAAYYIMMAVTAAILRFYNRKADSYDRINAGELLFVAAIWPVTWAVCFIPVFVENLVRKWRGEK